MVVSSRVVGTAYMMGGVTLLTVLSFLSVSSNVPRIYSPYPLTQLVAWFAAGQQSSLLRYSSFLLVPLLFLAWSNQLLRTEGRVPARSLVVFPAVAVLGVADLVYNWPYGVGHQGLLHTATLAAATVVLLGAAIVLLLGARRRPSFRTSYAGHLMFFVWFAWGAFPYLGESI